MNRARIGLVLVAGLSVTYHSDGMSNPNWDGQIGQYLPPEVARAVRPLMQQIQTELQSSTTSAVRFVSDESTEVSRVKITNEVSFASSGATDLWFMRQKQDQLDGDDPSRWSQVAIVLNRQATSKKAYYLEFSPGIDQNSQLPKPIGLRVDCLRCHANGPRLIRPRDIPDLHLDEKKLSRWNHMIAESGPIKIGSAKRQFSKFPDSQFYSKDAAMKLDAPTCIQCHDDHSSIRGPLLKTHLSSISYLMTHGSDESIYSSASDTKPAMPMDGRLLASERACIGEWVLGRVSSCQRETSRNGPSAGDGKINIIVKSNLNQFQLTGGTLTQTLKANKAQCQLIYDWDLNGVTSGLSIRDVHLQEQVIQDETSIHIETNPFSCAHLKSSNPGSEVRSITIQGFGRALSLPVVAQCKAKLTCLLQPFQIDVRSLGIPLPHFLHLSIEPMVEVHVETVFPPTGKQAS